MRIKAGLVNGETVHTDVTLIRDDVSWDSLSTEHAQKVLEENEGEAVVKRELTVMICDGEC
jgi:hypothetical protein